MEEEFELDDMGLIVDGELMDEENETSEGPKPLDDDQIEQIAATAVRGAVDFIDTEISPIRIKAQRYYDGEVDLGYETGRSKVVSTKVRDTIRAIKPSLMRIFLSTSKAVEFVPQGPEDTAFAEQASTFINWKFGELDGYKILNDVFSDALIKKVGIAKAFYEEKDTSKVYTFTDLDDEQYNSIISDADIEVIEHSQTTEASSVTTDQMQMEQPPVTMHDVKILRRSSKGSMQIASVPPEEFFIDRNSRSIDDCYVCGHRTNMRAGDLIAMGYDDELVATLDSSTDITDTTTTEEEARRGYSINPDEDENALDPSMKNVMVTEAFMRIDADGTGIPILHRVIMGGTSYKLLDYMPCDEIPFAVFETEPTAHAFFGQSIADIVQDDQDAATAILRGILDNVAMVNNPRFAAVSDQVNMDDLLSNEIGAIVRMRAPGMVQSLDTPFVAGQTLTALNYLDMMVEQKTGVTRASMGLNADAMQSTTKAAVQATVQAAAGQVEVMARNLAEGGLKRLFKLMLGIMVKNADSASMMRLNGSFQAVDPRAWNTLYDVTVNVGLGTGREDEKAAAYRETLALQMQVYQQYGPTNGVVTLTNIRNTVSDMLASSGVRNAERYFQPMTPELEQQIMQKAQQAEQQQQTPTDPNQAFLQAEQMKAAQKGQTDMVKLQLDAQRMQMDDDRKRDEMAQELALKNIELLGKYNLQANAQAIKAEQDAQRMMAPQGMR
jgi:hypothetical protein